MIVKLPKKRGDVAGVTGDKVLDGLRDYWRRQCGAAPAPRSDGLYLSDLIREMPHILMCFRDGARFRIEFAGCEAQDLLGFDRTGEELRFDDSERILAGVARAGAIAARKRQPELSRGDGWMAIQLPFVEACFAEACEEVSVLLVGLVTTARRPSAMVLKFKEM